MTQRLKEDDIFLLHGFGDRDEVPVFVRIDERGRICFTKHRNCASEFSQAEACLMIEDGKKQRRKLWAIRCVGAIGG